MYDNSLHFSQLAAKDSIILQHHQLVPDSYVLCTIHRAENTDQSDHLKGIFEGLLKVCESSRQSIVLPLHPRTRKLLSAALGSDLMSKIQNSPRIKLIDPVGFIDMIALESNASLVITDSGGVQKEAYFFKKPCVILREQTEWIELVENGNALLAGHRPEEIIKSFNELTEKKSPSFPPIFGDGKAAHFICQTIVSGLAHD